MLQNFRFARYRFTYTVLEPLRLPQYKGNVFGNRFRYTLRDITCLGDMDQCNTQCQLADQCVYARCFETPVPDESPVRHDQPWAPHPFVLEPPRTRKLEYALGDTLVCHIILIGDSINLLPWLVFTFNEVGKRRIGLQGKRGRCLLEKVESLSARGDGQHQTVYTAETQTLAENSLILRPDGVMRTAPNVAHGIELEFLTPTNIKGAGHWASDLRFEHFIGDLLHRIRFLSYFHCGEDFNVDTSVLRKAANSVMHESHLRWFGSDRRSHRAESSIPVGGFIGRIRYSGNLAPFLPFIYLGEYLHIGPYTALGYGQYRLRGITR